MISTQNSAIERIKNSYENIYGENGLRAQRSYPNEELLRFLGREYLSKVNYDERQNIKILELGCGSCANLWMIAKENFDAYGLDLSANGIAVGHKMLDNWQVKASLKVGSMTDIPFDDEYFDAIFDVFSTFHLNDYSFGICLDEVVRCLKPSGKFFSYTPSAKSDAYKNYEPAHKIDKWTLDGIKRNNSAYFGVNEIFRFIDAEYYRNLLKQREFEITYLESVGRTYSNCMEYFEFLTIVGKKI